MKLGTQVQMGDGRVGTCVYNGLDGEGVRWGLHDPDPVDFEGTVGGLEAIGVYGRTPPPDWPWRSEAMLRDPYPGADLPCVGRDFVILRYGLGKPLAQLVLDMTIAGDALAEAADEVAWPWRNLPDPVASPMTRLLAAIAAWKETTG